jgi:hypothetical protein
VTQAAVSADAERRGRGVEAGKGEGAGGQQRLAAGMQGSKTSPGRGLVAPATKFSSVLSERVSLRAGAGQPTSTQEHTRSHQPEPQQRHEQGTTGGGVLGALGLGGPAPARSRGLVSDFARDAFEDLHSASAEAKPLADTAAVEPRQSTAAAGAHPDWLYRSSARWSRHLLSRSVLVDGRTRAAVSLLLALPDAELPAERAAESEQPAAEPSKWSAALRRSMGDASSVASLEADGAARSLNDHHSQREGSRQSHSLGEAAVAASQVLELAAQGVVDALASSSSQGDDDDDGGVGLSVEDAFEVLQLAVREWPIPDAAYRPAPHPAKLQPVPRLLPRVLSALEEQGPGESMLGEEVSAAVPGAKTVVDGFTGEGWLARSWPAMQVIDPVSLTHPAESEASAMCRALRDEHRSWLEQARDAESDATASTVSLQRLPAVMGGSGLTAGDEEGVTASPTPFEYSGFVPVGQGLFNAAVTWGHRDATARRFQTHAERRRQAAAGEEAAEHGSITPRQAHRMGRRAAAASRTREADAFKSRQWAMGRAAPEHDGTAGSWQETQVSHASPQEAAAVSWARVRVKAARAALKAAEGRSRFAELTHSSAKSVTAARSAAVTAHRAGQAHGDEPAGADTRRGGGSRDSEELGYAGRDSSAIAKQGLADAEQAVRDARRSVAMAEEALEQLEDDDDDATAPQSSSSIAGGRHGRQQTAPAPPGLSTMLEQAGMRKPSAADAPADGGLTSMLFGASASDARASLLAEARRRLIEMTSPFAAMAGGGAGAGAASGRDAAEARTRQHGVKHMGAARTTRQGDGKQRFRNALSAISPRRR